MATFRDNISTPKTGLMQEVNVLQDLRLMNKYP